MTNKGHKKNFQSLRNQLVTKTFGISYCSECYEIHNLKQKCCGIKVVQQKLSNFRIKEWQIETPKEIRAHAVKDIIKAYKTCFSKKQTFNMRFKSKKQKNGSLGIQKQSISFKNGKLKIYSKTLKTMKLGKRTLSRMKQINHDCRLIFDGLYFYLCIPYNKEPAVKQSSTEKTIALDPGLRCFQTGYSELETFNIERNTILKKLILKLDFLSTKRRFKYHRRKTQNKINNIVDDLQWKTITYITKNYKNILLPSFESQEMTSQNKHNNRSFNILKHYQFKERLKTYINEIPKSQLYIVNEAYTSKTCSQCGTMNNDLGNQKIFSCIECNVVMDRDINGARNILIKHIV